MLQNTVDDYITALSTREDKNAETNINTVMAYRNDLTQLALYLQKQGIEQWSQVTHEHIMDYLLDMREGQSYRPTTIARKFAACKSFFRYLRKESLIESDPVDQLETPPISKEPPQILTAEQISNLFQTIPKNTVAGQRDFAMLHMQYATGMRASELVALNVQDVHIEQFTVTHPGRSALPEAEQLIPLHSSVVETVTFYLARTRPRLMRHIEEQALFLNHHGERLTRQGFWLIVKSCARQVGIEKITPHMLRNSFAMLMIRGGTDLRFVQELLEHTRMATAQVYNQGGYSTTHDK
jgi:integrase/recombinase XerD